MSLRRSLLAVVLVCLTWQLVLPRGAAQDTLADVVERCERAVVKIEVEGNDGASLGSGFIVDATGTLVTNVHVLAGARKATATFPNGTKCEIRGTLLLDPARDICIAKIDGANFESLPIATVPPRKGESVTALGSPKGLSFSATTGIVSAIRPAEELGPEIGRPEIKGVWIQVDAALSGGNSGGPLINAKGEVVGMSTLASQGSAQNLNFGISGSDILSIVQAANGRGLVALPDGVGKMTPSSAPQSSQIIQRQAIPKERLERYISEGKAAFKDLLRGMRQELSRNSELLKEMRRGKDYLPPGSPEAAQIVRVIHPRSKKMNYFFRTQAVKTREVSRLEDRIRELESINKSVTDPGQKDSLYTLLSKYGPRLDPRRNGSVGFLFDSVVLHSFNEHDVIVIYEDRPYLLWVESTVGLSAGSELTPAPVYVAGTETVTIPGGTPISVTVLHTVTDSEFREALFGSATAASDQWRYWKDSSGKFQVEATLQEVTEKEVVLKKRDGTTIKVPLVRLSTTDREFLGSAGK